jgi:hypothetical protein
VQDLESKLAEYRERGVQATKEVQVAAQRVIKENERLKDFLRQIGYNDEAISDWVNQNGAPEHATPTLRLKEVSLARLNLLKFQLSPCRTSRIHRPQGLQCSIKRSQAIQHEV